MQYRKNPNDIDTQNNTVAQRPYILVFGSIYSGHTVLVHRAYAGKLKFLMT